jgi:cholesterol oxidase
MAELQYWPLILVLWLVVQWLWNKGLSFIKAIFNAASERQEIFKSEDEFTNNMMCIVAQGREASVGQFRLGMKWWDSPLRVSRTDGLSFTQDPIVKEISATLDRLAAALGSKKKFINPFIGNLAEALKSESIATSHPLGGCPMGKSVADGVVDEFGRVFADSGTGGMTYYPGLYIVDASILPTAVGVNPSLTISALALRIAENIAKAM